MLEYSAKLFADHWSVAPQFRAFSRPDLGREQPQHLERQSPAVTFRQHQGVALRLGAQRNASPHALNAALELVQADADCGNKIKVMHPNQLRERGRVWRDRGIAQRGEAGKPIVQPRSGPAFD